MTVLFLVSDVYLEPNGAQVIRETELQNNAAPHTNTPPHLQASVNTKRCANMFPHPRLPFKMELYLEMDQRNETMHYSKCTAAAKNVT